LPDLLALQLQNNPEEQLSTRLCFRVE
jgi:hypothetical protein